MSTRIAHGIPDGHSAEWMLSLKTVLEFASGPVRVWELSIRRIPEFPDPNHFSPCQDCDFIALAAGIGVDRLRHALEFYLPSSPDFIDAACIAWQEDEERAISTHENIKEYESRVHCAGGSWEKKYREMMQDSRRERA